MRLTLLLLPQWGHGGLGEDLTEGCDIIILPGREGGEGAEALKPRFGRYPQR